MGLSHLLPLLGAEISDSEEGTLFSRFHLDLGPTYMGPFDALLAKIDEGQITLLDLSLTDITSAFLVFFTANDALSINAAAEFLFIIAYLLELKARGLLPAPKEESETIEEVEEDLVNRLEQYRVFKEIAEGLKQKRAYFMGFHAREKVFNDVKRPVKLIDVELGDLVGAFSKVWQELQKRGRVREIAVETITVEDKMKEIQQLISISHEGLDFYSLFDLNTEDDGLTVKRSFSYLEVVITFLAMLELAKRNLIRIAQENCFGPIKIMGVVN
ncbi:MAG: segregation/condensation protein A [Candidatus Saganbacteria bacterium]|nr:segregation/condensation protein A [Candidatus Saganbacteria bacterium]